MKTFKDFLIENEEGRFDIGFTEEWVEGMIGTKNVMLHPDKSISIHGSIQLDDHLSLIHEYEGQACLRVKFKEILGNFQVTAMHLDTMLGCPMNVTGYFVAWGNKFKNLEGIPKYVGKEIDLSHNKFLKSFKGINTLVSRCPSIVIPSAIEENLLGVMMIKNLESIRVSRTDQRPEKLELLRRAVDIINKHLEGDRDLLDCQEELRSVGLREFGKL